ncbi:ImmA/IrrE family metallo-endopeptidase [Megasphaera elsdenii]|jgi:hypothetical protein
MDEDEQKKKEIAEIDQLYESVLHFNTQRDFLEYMGELRKFPYLAPYNAMMVEVQKPGSRFVASLDTWQNKYHRRPKPGARPLVILRRFGPISFVYELDDTEGQKMPQEIISKYILYPFHSDTPIEDAAFQKLIGSLLKEGIRYREENYGTYYGGQLQWNAANVVQLSHTSKSHVDIISHYCITVNKNQSPAEKFATIIHELGHYFCGHLNYEKIEYLPVRTDLSKETQEFEAETVCWVVCERLNLAHQSVSYLHGYLNPDGKVPDISLDAILRSVGRIEKMIKGINEPRKNLKVKMSKEAYEALERTFPNCKKAIPVHFTDSKSYDYVLRIHNRSVKDDFLIVKYLPKEHQWICLYTFQMHADWNYVIEGHFTHHRHHEIIICGIFGSGHFLAYRVLAYVHNQVHTILADDAIPRGDVRIEGSRIIVNSGHLDSVYTWSKEDGFSRFDCPEELVSEIDADTIRLQYAISDDEKVEFYMDGEGYPSMKPIELQIGQKLQLQRIGRGPYERILGGNKFLQPISRHEYLAQSVGDATFRIIPKAYDWDRAVTFRVKVLPQDPVKESRFKDMQKELSIRKKKSIKDQIKKFLKNHNIINL